MDVAFWNDWNFYLNIRWPCWKLNVFSKIKLEILIRNLCSVLFPACILLLMPQKYFMPNIILFVVRRSMLVEKSKSFIGSEVKFAPLVYYRQMFYKHFILGYYNILYLVTEDRMFLMNAINPFDYSHLGYSYKYIFD